jgi:PAS domain S-box-containing protein
MGLLTKLLLTFILNVRNLLFLVVGNLRLLIVDSINMRQEKKFNKIHFAVFFLRIDENGIPSKIIDVNEYAYRILGYSHEDILSLCYSDLSDPLVLSDNKRIMQDLKPAEERIISDNFLHKRKYRVQFEFSAYIEEYNNESVIIIAGREITGHRLDEDTLRVNESRFHSIFENSPLPIFEEDFSAIRAVFDDLRKKGVHDIEPYLIKHPEIVQNCVSLVRIVDVNRAALKMNKANCIEELIDRSPNLFTQESFIAFRRQIVGLWNGETEMSFDSEIQTLTGEITQVNIHLLVCPAYEQTSDRIIVSMVDINERKQTEINLLYTNRALNVLSNCNKVLVCAKTETTLLNDICQVIVESGRYQLAWIGFIEHNKQKSIRAVAFAGFENGYIEKANVSWGDNKHGRGPTGRAIRTKQTVVCRDIATDESFALWRTDALERGYSSFVAIPMIMDDVVLGVIGIYAKEINSFDTEEMKLLEEVADNLMFGIKSLHTSIEHKRAEEALIESEERYRSLYEDNPSMYFTVDAAGTVLSVNRFGCEQLGYTVSELVGQSVLKVFHDEDKDIAVRSVTRCIENLGQVFQWELRKISRMGSLMWVKETARAIQETDGKVVVYIVCGDITKRKQAEEALHKFHEELQRTLRFNEALLSAIPTPVFYKDKEGRYLGCNNSFSKIMGVTSDEIKGKTVEELWPAEHAIVNRFHDLELMKNPVHQIYEFKVMDKDGLERQVIYYKNVFHDENEQVAGIVGAFLDITERKKSEEELVKAKEKAEESNRLKSEFLAIMNHELRTSNHIMGLSDLIQSDTNQKNAIEYAGIINKSGQCLLNIFEDIFKLVIAEKTGSESAQEDSIN